MRKIENEMVDAFNANRTFKKANTEVWKNSADLIVLLHGNIIAVKHGELSPTPNALQVFDGGWQTVPTKSRLNALLHGLDFGLCQRKGKWFLIKNLCSNNRVYVPFVSGMIVE